MKGRLKAIKNVLGDLPVSALEKPHDIVRFNALYRKGREIATVNRALATLRAAINWGRFQDPPYLTTTPFHRFGVNIKVKEETKRDRRIGVQEEQGLLAAALAMSCAEHKYVGSRCTTGSSALSRHAAVRVRCCASRIARSIGKSTRSLSLPSTRRMRPFGVVEAIWTGVALRRWRSSIKVAR